MNATFLTFFLIKLFAATRVPHYYVLESRFAYKWHKNQHLLNKEGGCRQQTVFLPHLSHDDFFSSKNQPLWTPRGLYDPF